MFTSDAIIDAVQTSKKTWVKTFVTNDNIAKAMNDFVESQTEYTKKAFKATTDAATVISNETVKAFKDAGKFDYAKFGEGIMKAYQAQTAKATANA